MSKVSRLKVPIKTSGVFVTSPFDINSIDYNKLNPAFSFEYVQEDYCLSKWEAKKIKSLIQKLGKLEKHTWSEIQVQLIYQYSKVDKTGIKVKIPDFITPDVNIYYMKPFGSDNKYRIFGIRDKHNFKFLWFDDKHEVYPGKYR